MKQIYIEQAIAKHPRTQIILARFKESSITYCEHYQEVFNPKSQNFRIQKQNPALILAQKTGNRVLPTPEGFGIGGEQNYYFSHMLNCLYDCRYCFLQGMYPSANHVIFVNYEDFMMDIEATIKQHQSSYFFSGYDCDSLAYDPVTGFLSEFLPFFTKQPNAILELRTKSTNIRALQKHQPFNNCVVAFSFTPDAISRAVEHKVPSVQKRLQAMQTLAQQGWRIGLRLDPLIYCDDYQNLYKDLIANIFKYIQPGQLHSVSLGPLRFPERMYQKLIKLYPKDLLLAQPLLKRDKHFSYKAELEQTMKIFVTKQLERYIDNTLLFECSPL